MGQLTAKKIGDHVLGNADLHRGLDEAQACLLGKIMDLLLIVLPQFLH